MERPSRQSKSKALLALHEDEKREPSQCLGAKLAGRGLLRLKNRLKIPGSEDEEYICPPPLRERLGMSTSNELTTDEDESEELVSSSSSGDDDDNDDVNDDDTDDSNEEDYSGEEDARIELPTELQFISPSGEKWTCSQSSNKGRYAAVNVLRKKPGITPFATARINENQASAFNLIFDDCMKETIVYETNREGKRVKGEEWKPLTIVELDVFIGLIILRGAVKSNGESIDELWSPTIGRSIFRERMSLSRFKAIRRHLRFDNKATRNSRLCRDKLAAVRLLIDGIMHNSQRTFYPGPSITIDEELYPYRGRCPFKQYMPNKPAKYGLKFWLLCDSSTSYCWNLQMYTGKDDTRQVALGEHVVLQLTSQLNGSGLNVTVDNFFTSLSLARQLQLKGMTLVGTFRNNRREIPRELTSYKNRQLYSSIFSYTVEDRIQLVSYKSKKNKIVLVCSSQHSSKETLPHRNKKPAVIQYYNETKGGVDALDQRIGAYSVQWKSRRWHIPVFCNLVDIAAYNSYILFQQCFPNWSNKSHRRRLFLIELAEQLSAQEKPDQWDSRIPPNLGALKGRCFVCPRVSDRKTRAKCSICEGFVCEEHSQRCCIKCRQHIEVK
jgi:hypothetical protein